MGPGHVDFREEHAGDNVGDCLGGDEAAQVEESADEVDGEAVGHAVHDCDTKTSPAGGETTDTVEMTNRLAEIAGDGVLLDDDDFLVDETLLLFLVKGCICLAVVRDDAGAALKDGGLGFFDHGES